MAEKDFTFTVPFKVRSYEVDHRQEASISVICNYFQEAAGLHAQELQFDISDLQKEGLTWILYKLQVNVYTFPKRWESTRVTTWPSTGDGLRAYRDYKLYNEKNEVLATGLSQWMVMDIRKKRPVKIPKELMNNDFSTGQHVLKLYKNSLPGLTSENAMFITKAGFNDLDMNKHVNNVRYIDWITGYNLSKRTKEKKCNEINIQYASETAVGDQIYLASEADPDYLQNGIVNYSLFKNEGKHIIANAKTHWV